MPSKSYITFLKLMEDVHKLKNSHFDYSQGKRGRKNLGYLTRSAMVMLCAAWERYNENLLIECIDVFLESGLTSDKLPKSIKKTLSSKVKNDKNEVKPIELADDGWKRLWKGYAEIETDLLHTPNSGKLNTLFTRYLGIKDYATKFWYRKDVSKIDKFIKERGEIAHKGSEAKYTRMNHLRKMIDVILDNAIQIDYSMAKHLNEELDLEDDIWELTYSKDLKKYK